jgi:hypothetical protein
MESKQDLYGVSFRLIERVIPEVGLSGLVSVKKLPHRFQARTPLFHVSRIDLLDMTAPDLPL